MTGFRSHVTYANVVATLALFLALGGGAVAAANFVSSDGQIHACVSKAGSPVLVKAKTHCNKGQSAISWNHRGPQGNPGTQGAQGNPGTQGAQGNAGAPGLDGTNGAPGQPGPSGIVGFSQSQINSGPLPTTFHFSKAKDDTRLVVTVSGTGYSSTAGQSTQLLVFMGGCSYQPVPPFYFNNAGEHLTLPTVQLDALAKGPACGIGAGPFTVTLSSNHLTSDGNDSYSVSVLEYKPAG
jgi:hypothetical protein